MPNGEVIASQGKNRPIFQVTPIIPMQKPAGLAGAIGSALGRIADQLREYRPFKRARRFVRGLGLKSQAEWYDYCASGKKPLQIPSNPSNTYAGKGWVGVGDWLGTGTVAPFLRLYRSFKKARAFARSLGLNSVATGTNFVSQARSPATFRAILIIYTQNQAGPVGAIGSGLAGFAARVGEFLKRPAPLCAVSV